MQELLSGKKRLRGFSEKWTSLEFSDCFYVQSKIKGEKKQDYLKEGLFPVVDQSQNKIAGYSNNQDFVIKNSLPFIIFGDHTRILKLIDFPFILGNDGTKVFQGKEKYDTTFLFYLLDTISVPNTGYNRHFKFLKDLILEIPKLKEQKAIADILVMADREIEKLEEKLKIIKEQKKFLLNNLITGNIRTPVDKK
ncbi:MAG: Restriction modification system DNA specificity subunit [uncultured bacterium]|nr:MAG: Restriction modification system DNA specificity subunit [uncultured bacterium]